MSNFATLNIISLTPSCILQENEIILWTTSFVEMRLHIAHGLSFILQILHYDQYSSFSMPKVQSTIVANIPALKIDRSSWMLKKHWPTISKPKRCTTMGKSKQAFSVHNILTHRYTLQNKCYQFCLMEHIVLFFSCLVW